jgi:hypothetical protein
VSRKGGRCSLIDGPSALVALRRGGAVWRVLGVLTCIFALSCGPQNDHDGENPGAEPQALPPAGTALEVAAQCMALGITATIGGAPLPDHVRHWTALASLGDRARAEELAERWVPILLDPANTMHLVEASALCSTSGSFALLVEVPQSFADFPEDPIERLGACGQVLARAAAIGSDDADTLVDENHRRLIAYEIVLEGDRVDIDAAKRVGEQWYQARSGSGAISSEDFQGCMLFSMGLRPL